MFEGIVRETRCEEFQVAEFSLQHDHVHMLCEPRGRRALEMGMRRLTIRFSLGLNALFGRSRGKNWSGRYHRHDLKTPREVRNALVYVLMNGKKHGEVPHDARWLDPFSSACEFDGWSDTRPSPRNVCGPPRFWLLAVGWKKHGLLSPTEAPLATLSSGR